MKQFGINGPRNIYEFPRELGLLYNLKDLLLFGFKNVTTIPVEICKLKGLEKLEIHNCGLTHIPDEIGEMESLKFLNLSNNYLKCIPSTIGNLKNLETLKFHSNKLEYLPDEIGKLPQLKNLALDNNLLTNVDILIPLTNLISLNIWHNNIKTIPESLKTIPYLFY
jgi:Leucine-rich repeat (LRR) protein